MKRTIALLLLVASAAVAADAVDRFAFACRLPRAEAVTRVADAFARHGWEVTAADRELGTITGRHSGGRQPVSWHVTLHAAADGDSLRVLVYRTLYEGPRAGPVTVQSEPDLYAPILDDLRRIAP